MAEPCARHHRDRQDRTKAMVAGLGLMPQFDLERQARLPMGSSSASRAWRDALVCAAISAAHRSGPITRRAGEVRPAAGVACVGRAPAGSYDVYVDPSCVAARERVGPRRRRLPSRPRRAGSAVASPRVWRGAQPRPRGTGLGRRRTVRRAGPPVRPIKKLSHGGSTTPSMPALTARCFYSLAPRGVAVVVGDQPERPETRTGAWALRRREDDHRVDHRVQSLPQ